MANFISEEDVEKALDWLRDNSEPAAKARAESIYVREYRKTMKAQIMGEHVEKPLAAQEREAYADPRYVAYLDVIRTAIAIDEELQFLRAAAEAKIRAWQTMCSNERGPRP